MTLQDCPRCGNWYLGIRHDLLATKRPVVCCDMCGAMAEPELWNRIEPMPDRKYSSYSKDDVDKLTAYLMKEPLE